MAKDKEKILLSSYPIKRIKSKRRIKHPKRSSPIRLQSGLRN
jgi:hypothetical protein